MNNRGLIHCRINSLADDLILPTKRSKFQIKSFFLKAKIFLFSVTKSSQIKTIQFKTYWSEIQTICSWQCTVQISAYSIFWNVVRGVNYFSRVPSMEKSNEKLNIKAKKLNMWNCETQALTIRRIWKIFQSAAVFKVPAVLYSILWRSYRVRTTLQFASCGVNPQNSRTAWWYHSLQTGFFLFLLRQN